MDLLILQAKCEVLVSIEPKNYENTGSWLQIVTNSKGGGTFCPTPLQKKEALSGFLEVWVLFAEDVGDPEAADIVGQGFGGHEAQAVLLGDVFEFDCCITHFSKLFFFLLVNQKRGSMTPSVQCKYLIACS